MITKEELNRLCMDNLDYFGVSSKIRGEEDFLELSIEALIQCYSLFKRKDLIIAPIALYTFYLIVFAGWRDYDESFVKTKMETGLHLFKDSISLISFIISIRDTEFKGRPAVASRINDLVLLIELEGYDSKKTLERVVKCYPLIKERGLGELVNYLGDCKK